LAAPAKATMFGFNETGNASAEKIRKLKRADAEAVQFPVSLYPDDYPTAVLYGELRAVGIPMFVLGGWQGAPVNDPAEYGRQVALISQTYPKATSRSGMSPMAGRASPTSIRPRRRSRRW
jgi:hypothetical protein